MIMGEDITWAQEHDLLLTKADGTNVESLKLQPHRQTLTLDVTTPLSRSATYLAS